MSQSYVQLFVHLIFGTKEMYPFLDPSISRELFPYLTTIMHSMDCPVLAVNGMSEHIHILFSLSKNHALSDVVEEVKKSSSKWVKTKGPAYEKFYWQGGYGAFSMGRSGVPALKKYIKNQQEHHRRKTFREEVFEFLKKYEITIDERYFWFETEKKER
jgi:putative transposase